ncbi:MAG: hypothetical protein [Microvirus sp.]|nr:MAG: hypothetical protein [Microvirus sp.]
MGQFMDIDEASRIPNGSVRQTDSVASPQPGSEADRGYCDAKYDQVALYFFDDDGAIWYYTGYGSQRFPYPGPISGQYQIFRPVEEAYKYRRSLRGAT